MGFAEDMSAWWKSPGARTLKRGLLGFLTMGTSEIKTGGGEYGDEVLADSLFPKTINNFLLDDREAARRAADKAQEDALKKADPGPPPDIGTGLLRRAGATELMRGRRSSRRSSFFGS